MSDEIWILDLDACLCACRFEFIAKTFSKRLGTLTPPPSWEKAHDLVKGLEEKTLGQVPTAYLTGGREPMPNCGIYIYTCICEYDILYISIIVYT